MKSQLFAVLTRRRLAGLAALVGALVVLALIASVVDAQQPKLPHLFWGRDAGQYSGATITAVNQNGVEVQPAIEGGGVVNPDGSWSLAISPDDARTVVLRLTLGEIVRETDSLDVIEAEFPTEGISIADFSNTVAAASTKEIRVIARLHPTRPLRTLEFNIRVGGVDVDPAPTRRFFTPGLENNRWYQSIPVSDLGDGFEARVIACRQDDGDVVFGVRVEGHDDVLPSGRVFFTRNTHNRWLHSTPIEISRPSDNQDVVRLGRGDTGCTGSP
ncbi:MAG: hypothetical protein OXH38_01205 [Chloroflexi bacterium]|nr:hypothetical protein [Chloroflexota bacterium]